jgi:DNA-binding GntR family transcriptional regulator
MSEKAPMYGNRTRSLADQAYDRVEELIVTLALPPGDTFSEGDLAERIGIGRTPLREALQRLAADRMVEVQPRRGLRVMEVDAEDYLNLLETRAVLDRLLAVQAARRVGPAEQDALRDCVERMGRAAMTKDVDAFLRADREADQMIEEASRNPWAASAAASLHVHCRRFWMAHEHRADMARSAALHAAVIQQIADADPQKAGQACDALIAYLKTFAREALDL